MTASGRLPKVGRRKVLPNQLVPLKMGVRGNAWKRAANNVIGDVGRKTEAFDVVMVNLSFGAGFR